jgi:hypothetical protein
MSLGRSLLEQNQFGLVLIFKFGRIQFGILVGPGPLPPPMGPAHAQMPQLDPPPCPPVSPVVDRHLPPPLACPVNRRTPPSFVPHRTGPPARVPHQEPGPIASSSLRIGVTEKTHRARIPQPPSRLPITLLSTPTAGLVPTSSESKP